LKLTKQELKYQAKQQLSAKFRSQSVDWWSNINNKIDITQLLKRVVK